MLKLLFFFIIPSFLFSAPIGAPAFPSMIEDGFFIPDTKWVNLRAGYQAYNVGDLILQFDPLLLENNFYLRKSFGSCNSAIITLNIKERLDLYVDIGAFCLETEFRNLSQLYKTKSETSPLYRAGARLILFEILDFTLATDAKYSIFHSTSSYITQNDTPVLNGKADYDFKEWQIGVGIGQKITILRPYIGVVYRDSQLEMKNNLFAQQGLKASFKKKNGVFFGSSASLGSFVFINAEMCFLSERATTISGELRF